MAAKRILPPLEELVPWPMCHTTGVDPTSPDEGPWKRCRKCGGVGFIKPPKAPAPPRRPS